MKKLSKNEIILINEGHDGTAYEAGKVVGDAIGVLLIVIPAGRLTKWTKNLF